MGRLVHALALPFVVVAALAVVSCGGGNPRTISKGPQLPTTCMAGFCVKPDHVVARRADPADASSRRCTIVAWDGDSDLPPTARTSTMDDAPARPGVFFSVEVPSLRSGTPFGIKSDGSTSGATVLVVRVDPAVKFADRRIVDAGTVTVVPQGDDLLVMIKSTSAAGEETTSIVVPKANNKCGPVIEI